MQCGSVERTLEPGRPRVTSNASAPHNSVQDADGFEVVPINVAIRQDLLHKEVKPTTAMDMTAMTILLQVVHILGETVFVMADDFKSYFNQLRLAPSEYHKTGMIHPPRVKAGQTQFASDTVLGFGIKMASNVAQRFGTFRVNCMRHIVNQEKQRWTKDKRATNPAFDDWCLRREAYGADSFLSGTPCIMLRSLWQRWSWHVWRKERPTPDPCLSMRICHPVPHSRCQLFSSVLYRASCQQIAQSCTLGTRTELVSALALQQPVSLMRQFKRCCAGNRQIFSGPTKEYPCMIKLASSTSQQMLVWRRRLCRQPICTSMSSLTSLWL